jgi:hypothetical protein
MAFVPTYRYSPRQHFKMIGEAIASWRSPSPTPEHVEVADFLEEADMAWRSPTPERVEVADFLEEDDMAWSSHAPRKLQ